MTIHVESMNATSALLIGSPGDSATKFIEHLSGYLDDYRSGANESPCEWLTQEAASRTDFPLSKIEFAVAFVGILHRSDGLQWIWVEFRWKVTQDIPEKV